MLQLLLHNQMIQNIQTLTAMLQHGSVKRVMLWEITYALTVMNVYGQSNVINTIASVMYTRISIN